jgi:flagellar hook-associated protein 3 FlgL
MRISTGQFQAVSIGSVLEQQAKLSKTQQQLATGRRILTPADDPAGASRALDLTANIGELERLQENANLSQSRLATEETALVEVGNMIQRVRELTIQANNDSNGSGERRLIAAEMRERLDQLVRLANSTDGNGEYLFAGAASRDQPFSKTAAGVVYNGDQTERMVQVGPTRQLVENHTGFDVFMKIPDGNGTFNTTAAAGNSGTGVVNGGRVLTPGAAAYPYQIELDDSTGELLYTVTDQAGDPMPGATGLPFKSGEAIRFAGLEVTITGTPAATDSFQVDRSRPRSLFKTVEELVTVLANAEDTTASGTNLHNRVGQSLNNLDQAAENIFRVRAEIGARLHAIDTEIDSNENMVLELKSARSKIEDLDYAKAISEFNLQMVGLQSAQQSYVKIQGLSLFNYL